MKQTQQDKVVNRTILARQRYFEKTVFHPKVKECISGKNESKVIGVLSSIGFVLDRDFIRQYPIGEKFVLDFAFVKEQVALEVDGQSHEEKKQRKSDLRRDSFLRSNNWIPIRIKDKDMADVYRFSFFKSLIKEVVGERRVQWESGKLFAIDIPNFNEKDYE